MSKTISVEPIEEADAAPGPEVPSEPSVPKELAESEAVEPPAEPEPDPEPEPTDVEDIQPTPKRRGRPKKEPVPPTEAKKPRGRPKKAVVEQASAEASSPPPQQPPLERADHASFSSEDIGQALQHLLAAHQESKAARRRDTYSKFNMF